MPDTRPTSLSALATWLTAQTQIQFALWAWAHAPGGTYGVVTMDQDSTFFAGGNAEHASRGYVDIFCRSDGFTEKSAVEDALNASGWHWWHSAVQFEEDTGTTHHTWSVAWLG